MSPCMLARSRVTVPVWSMVPAKPPAMPMRLRVQAVALVLVQAGESPLSA